MPKLNGTPSATLQNAREILKRAREEARGQRRGLRTRQAAEKVWLAVSTAADALVGPTETTAQVMDAFKRAWGTEGLSVAKDVRGSMHVACFYSDLDVCDGVFVEDHAARLGKLLHTPIRDSKIRERLAKRKRRG